MSAAAARPAPAATVEQRATYLCSTVGLFQRRGAIVERTGERTFRPGDRPVGNAAASLPRFVLDDGEGVYVATAIIGASGRTYAVGPVQYVDARQTFVMDAAGHFEPVDASALAVELPHHVASVREPTSAYTFYRSTRGGAVAYAIAAVPGHDGVCDVAGVDAPPVVEAAVRRSAPGEPPRALLAELESVLPAPAQ